MLTQQPQNFLKEFHQLVILLRVITWFFTGGERNEKWTQTLGAKANSRRSGFYLTIARGRVCERMGETTFFGYKTADYLFTGV